MAAEDRANASAVALHGALLQAPYRFDFFQALRRLECAHRNAPRLGEGTHAEEEPVRVTQEASLAFAPHAIAAVEHTAAGKLRIVTNFFGLLGPNGPLPLHITEYTRDRQRNSQDPTLLRFFDVFHHRALTLFYRAFANTRPTLNRDRPGADRFKTFVGSVFGFALPSHWSRDGLPDCLKLHFAARYASHPRNAEGLQALIAHFFGVRTSLEQFVGEWVDLPRSSRWRLGPAPLGSPLGRRTALGKRAWLCQSKFRIVVGPLDPDSFPRWLPGGENLERLEALVHSYVGDQLAWDVRLILAENTRFPWRLGAGSRLGWTCWLGARPTSLIVKPYRFQTPEAQAAFPRGPSGDPTKTGN